MSSRRESRAALHWLLLYTAISLLLFGVHIVGHMGSRIVASDQLDSSQFMWFLAWWPHALLHGLNPFVTHLMFVPSGFNLTWATAMPGPSVLLSPITLLFSPAVTWNVIQLSSPALSAWACFLLCRHVTGRTRPSLAGGFVFGFSPYMLVHLSGGPYLALVFLLPLIVLLVLRYVDGTMRTRRFIVLMTLALTGQYLISSEVLATATLFGVIALVLGYALMRHQRERLLAATGRIVVSYVGMAFLISPFLYYTVFGHHYPPGATHFSADLASFVVPSNLMAIGHRPTAFVGSSTENYLGLPLIALLALFVWAYRHRRSTWLLALTLAAAATCSLGSHLRVRGHQTSIPLPWLVFRKLPVLHYAIPVRLALFAALPAAVMVAMWLAAQPGSKRRSNAKRVTVWRWALLIAVIAFILPDVGNREWDTPIHDPAFFSSGAYRGYLKPTDNVLTIPAWGPNERWQADTGFRFRLSDGYAGNPFPAAYARYPVWAALTTGASISNWPAQLRTFIRAKRVTAIVVDTTAPGPWRRLFGSLGVHPVQIGGVLFYRLSSSSADAT